MVLEVGLIHDIVHEARGVFHAGCVCCGIRTVEGQGEVEVREFLLDLGEILQVEGLDEGACAVEEPDRLLGPERLEKMHDVAAERGHTGAAADEDILLRVRIVLRKEELSVRAADHHLVTFLAGEDIGGGDSRRNAGDELEYALRLGAVERRSRDTDVQFDDVLLRRI